MCRVLQPRHKAFCEARRDGKDRGHIYYSTIESGGAVTSAAVQHADVSTFTILDNPDDHADAKDKNALYLKGKKVKKQAAVRCPAVRFSPVCHFVPSDLS